jgi:hypothetical protein
MNMTANSAGFAGTAVAGDPRDSAAHQPLQRSNEVSGRGIAMAAEVYARSKK